MNKRDRYKLMIHRAQARHELMSELTRIDPRPGPLCTFCNKGESWFLTPNNAGVCYLCMIKMYQGRIKCG